MRFTRQNKISQSTCAYSEKYINNIIFIYSHRPIYFSKDSKRSTLLCIALCRQLQQIPIKVSTSMHTENSEKNSNFHAISFYDFRTQWTTEKKNAFI